MKRHRIAAMAVGVVAAIALLSAALSTQAKSPPATGPTTKPLTADEKAALLEKDVTQGALRVVQEDGTLVECPLKHTDVKADVSGFIARVKVTQTFSNPTKEKIEAVYVFPLPHESAVDNMTMVIGQRRIVGIIKQRAEARQIYEQALLAGHTAALLEQERPNIFTQSVGNIEPGQDVNIEISYVDVLKYDMGIYEFHFPMVVGPRYNPGAPTGTPPTPPELQGKVAPMQPNTTDVPDASRINPPVLKPGMRNGHDVSLSVNLNAGVPIQSLEVLNHQVDMQRDGRKATVKIAPHDTIPNKDFVMRYGLIGDKPEMAMLSHTGAYDGDARTLGAGYFMLMIQPKDDKRLRESPPREIVFLVDVSGSMSGGPIAKCIESMQHMLKFCREDKDTVQVITFASQAEKLFAKAVPVNRENIAKATAFAGSMRSGGGTEMLKGVKLAIDDAIDKDRVRIVIMLTDGYIGNEAQIIEHVGKNCGDQVRFWAIGIGSAPNMFLIDGVAKQGGGMGKKLALNEEAQPLCQEVMTRIQRAQLSKVKIDWGGLRVAETYPAKLPELWAGRPVILYGRFADGGKEAKITVSGSVEGQDVSWPLTVALPDKEPANDVLAKIWARQKIEDLMQQTYYKGSPEVEEVVTGIALNYSLMSQYTSFVAVDEKDAGKAAMPQARPPRRMLVPVPIPEGTVYEGFFGPGHDMPFDAGRVMKLEMLEKKLDQAQGRLQNGLRARDGRGFAANRPMAAGQAGQGSGWGGGGGGGGSGYAPSTMGPIMGKSGPAPFLLPPASPAPSFAAAPADRKLVRRLAAEPRRGGYFLEKEMRDSDGEWSYTQAAIAGNAQPLIKAAQEALVAGRELIKKADLRAARAMLLRAYFLDTAAANVHASNGQAAADALASLEQLHKDQVKAWAGQMPELNAKLDLVLRDLSIEQALAEVAKAAKLPMEFIPGSVEDSADVLNRASVRISWLDLRHATAAQALDWILRPARMNWWPAKGQIAAGTDRRGGVESAWVYDVSLIALPSQKEINELKDYQKMMAEAKKQADAFRKAVFDAIVSTPTDADAMAVQWYAPGQLLVIGDAQRHAAAAKLLADLRDPNAKLPAAIADVHKLTSKRYAERKDDAAKSAAAREVSRVAIAHDVFSWKLLAGAIDGKLDDEAWTELGIAWKAPQTVELLKSNPAIAMRSYWAISQSGQSLPDALKAVRTAADEQMAALTKDPKDDSAFAAVLYAALALRDDKAVVEKALSLLSAGRDAKYAPLVLAKAILGDAAAEAKSLAEIAASGISGDDMVVLTALACRRAGGEAWTAFRANAKEILGSQPLDGSIVVLVNRLAAGALPMLAAK